MFNRLTMMSSGMSDSTRTQSLHMTINGILVLILISNSRTCSSPISQKIKVNIHCNDKSAIDPRTS